MRVAIFGLGYVGSVLAGCLSARGHHVHGVDLDPIKVEALKSGRSPFFEPGLTEQISAGLSQGLLFAGTDAAAAVRVAEVIFVCVGTYTRWNGRPDFEVLLRTTEEIGRCLRETEGYRVVCIRSTVLPEVLEEEILPRLEQTSGKRVSEDFGLVCNPEFLREGSAVADFCAPALIVIGGADARSRSVVRATYEGIEGHTVETDLRTAALLKYVCNSFHALKIAFANEIGNICRAQGIDGHKLMEALCADHKLNISPAYLRPGFAFGGSCLIKDLQALIHEAKGANLGIPLLESILPSNENHFKLWLNLILETGKKRIGLVGLTFKKGTDDLRNSPLVELAESLYGKGLEVTIYDRHLSLASIYGSNLRYLMERLPHISQLLVASLEELVERSEVIVLGQTLASDERALLGTAAKGQVCFDLVRALEPEALVAKECSVIA